MENWQAILVVLFLSKRSLTCKQIVQEIRMRGWNNVRGKTPENTVDRDLNRRRQLFSQDQKMKRLVGNPKRHYWYIWDRETASREVAWIMKSYPSCFTPLPTLPNQKQIAAPEVERQTKPQPSSKQKLPAEIRLNDPPNSRKYDGNDKSQHHHRTPSQRSNGPVRPPDPFRRRRVEDAAVQQVIEHFTCAGYVVDSRAKDNLGWDLEAVRGTELLRLEVKGLSGAKTCVELTPNEFQKMEKFQDSFRLCVVTSALTSPTLAVFAYSHETEKWSDDNGRTLEVERRIAARCRVK